MRLSDLQHKFLRQAFSKSGHALPPVLAINAGGAATVKTTNAINYSIDGKWFTKAALAALVLATDATLQAQVTGSASYGVQPISTTVYYLGIVDATGTVKFLQGTYNGQAFTPYIGPKGSGDIPSPLLLGDTYAPFGVIKIVTNASTTFTPATTALDAAGLTVTFTDIDQIPSTNI